MLALQAFKRSRLKNISNYQLFLGLQGILTYPNLHMADRAIQLWRNSHFESGKLADDIDSLMLQIFLKCSRLDLIRSYYSYLSSERKLTSFFIAQCMLQADPEFRSLVYSCWNRDSFTGLEFITSAPVLYSNFLNVIFESCSDDYEMFRAVFVRLKSRDYSDLGVLKKIINLALSRKWNHIALQVYQYSNSLCKYDRSLELERALIFISYGDLHGACLNIHTTKHAPEIFGQILRYLALKKSPLLVFSEWTQYMWEICDASKFYTIVDSLVTYFYTKGDLIYGSSVASFLHSKKYPPILTPISYHTNSKFSGIKIENCPNDVSHNTGIDCSSGLSKKLSISKPIDSLMKETHPSLDLVALAVTYLWTSKKNKIYLSTKLLDYLSRNQDYVDLSVCIYQRVRISARSELNCKFYQSLLNGYGKFKPANVQYIMKDMESDNVAADTFLSTKIIQCMTLQSNQSADLISNWAHQMDNFAAAVILQSLARSRNHKLALEFFKLFKSPTIIMYTSLIASFPKKDGRIMAILKKASKSKLAVDLKFISVLSAYGFKPKYLSSQTISIVGYKFRVSDNLRS